MASNQNSRREVPEWIGAALARDAQKRGGKA